MREINMISDRILKQLIAADDPTNDPRKPAKRKEPEGVDHTTRPVLMERAAYLKQMARASEGSTAVSAIAATVAITAARPNEENTAFCANISNSSMDGAAHQAARSQPSKAC